MVARAVAFVIMPMAVDMQQIEFVEQAVALEHFERAIDGHAMHSRIDFLGAFQDGIGGQVLLGLVHDVQQDAALAREPHALACKRGAQFSRLGIDVEPLTGGDTPMIVLSRPALVSSLARLMGRSHGDQWLGKSRSTSLYITIRNTSSRKTIPTVTKRSLIFRLRS